MTESLFVHYGDQTIGTLTRTETGLMEFSYRSDWQNDRNSFAISISLPLSGQFDVDASHHFFVNLLPEANVRQQICK